MKVAILGCSHSAGLVSKMSVDMEKGWVPMLAKLYPDHEFHVYATAGHGYYNMQQGIRSAYLQNCDMIILQNTTPREWIPICDTDTLFKSKRLVGTPNVVRHYKNQHGVNVKHTYSNIRTERFQTLKEGKYLPNRRYSVPFRCCTDVCNSYLPKKVDNLKMHEMIHDGDMVCNKEGIWQLNATLDDYKKSYKNTHSYNSNMIGYAFTNLDGSMFNNKRFDDMIMSQLKQKNLLKKVFKHVFHFTFVGWFSSPDDFTSEYKEIQKHQWDDIFDWSPDVTTWVKDFLSEKLNISLGIASKIFAEVWWQHAGHLGEDYFQYFVHNYLLQNDQFATALES